jgi:hypothetical protein
MWYAHGFWLWTRPAGYQRSICRVNSIHGNFVIPRETSSFWSTKQPSCTGTRCCHRSHRESIPAEFPAPLDCFEREARQMPTRATKQSLSKNLTKIMANSRGPVSSFISQSGCDKNKAGCCHHKTRLNRPMLPFCWYTTCPWKHAVAPAISIISPSKRDPSLYKPPLPCFCLMLPFAPVSQAK